MLLFKAMVKKKRKKGKSSGRNEYMDLNTYLTVLSENQEFGA